MVGKGGSRYRIELTLGVNIWPHVHIDDTADLFAVVYAGALKDSIGHGRTGFYFGTAGEYNLLGAAEIIGRALVEQGYAKIAEPKSLTEEELKKYYGGSYGSGSNSRAVSERSLSVGWKPKYTEMSELEKHIGEEMRRLVEKFGKTYSRSNK